MQLYVAAPSFTLTSMRVKRLHMDDLRSMEENTNTQHRRPPATVRPSLLTNPPLKLLSIASCSREQTLIDRRRAPAVDGYIH